jgi:hypothetical protein
VAFAFTHGYLILATRDDLVAQSLELLAGNGGASAANDRWYRDAVAQAAGRGELRMAMNLELLTKSVHFRSYWVHRNVSAIRPYWTGVVDVKRSTDEITETRTLLRTPGSDVASGSTAVQRLLPLVPPGAGVYKAFAASDPEATAALIVNKVVGAPPEQFRDWRYAPQGDSPDTPAGTEADLESRIDEQPLPVDTGAAASLAAIRSTVEKGGARAMLLVQASTSIGTFIKLPAVIVLEGAGDWNRDAVRSALGEVAGALWTTSQLGARWTAGTAGRHPVDRMDGLGTLLVASDGPLLFLSNDSALLTAVLDRRGNAASVAPFTYAAGFRHLREQANYRRIMNALDFTPAGGFAFGGAEAPSFFSGNIASLSGVLSSVAEIRVTEEERGQGTVQTVHYQIPR